MSTGEAIRNWILDTIACGAEIRIERVAGRYLVSDSQATLLLPLDHIGIADLPRSVLPTIPEDGEMARLPKGVVTEAKRLHLPTLPDTYEQWGLTSVLLPSTDDTLVPLLGPMGDISYVWRRHLNLIPRWRSDEWQFWLPPDYGRVIISDIDRQMVAELTQITPVPDPLVSLAYEITRRREAALVGEGVS